MPTRGKAAEWLKTENIIRIQGWARDGLTDEEMSEKMGIARKTLWEWKKRYPEISKALTVGKETADYLVENTLFKKACSGDVTAMIFWLKNRKPAQWRDKPAPPEVQRAVDDSFIKALDEKADKDWEDSKK